MSDTGQIGYFIKNKQYSTRGVGIGLIPAEAPKKWPKYLCKSKRAGELSTGTYSSNVFNYKIQAKKKCSTILVG